MNSRLWLIFLFIFVSGGLADADVRLPSIISDHMVLLRAEKVPVWGWADVGEEVSVTFNGQKLQTKAGADGKWRVDLNLKDSGIGPFEMIVAGRNVITIRDVLVGEVWLGSGQSNMEQMMFSQKHADEETATADNPMLRQFITIKTVSMNPQEDVEGFWLVVTPGQTETMSALGYYFGQEVYKATKSPVGIIKASWGGQRIECFIPSDSYDLSESRREIREQSRDNVRLRAEAFGQWLDETRRADRSGADRKSYIHGPASATDGWVHVKDSGPVDPPELPQHGAMWFRKEVTLTTEQSNVPQYMFLGMQDVDFFSVYFNGKLVEESNMENYTNSSRLTSRIYIPPELMQEGVNHLALRIFAPQKRISFAWAPMFNGQSATGGWWAKPEYRLPELPEAASRMPQAPLSLLRVDCAVYDGMIRPLIPYALRGVLWYQGESNVRNAYEYRELMPLLIEGWRTEWGIADMPFYLCQLAEWKEKKDMPGESDWAELREAQLMTLSLPNTGMAVLIGTGESEDIHPQTKDVAGERLAKIALAKVYNKPVPYSGPIYESMVPEGSKIRLRFRHLEGGLIAQKLPEVCHVNRILQKTEPLVRNSPDSELEGFAICGADQKWVWANAKIDHSTSSGQAGETVLVWSDKVSKPVAVRYAWADNPTSNLFNKAGLPASPFRTDDFNISTQKKID